MVGKFNLDLGEDYAFDPKRAKEVAEGVTAQQPAKSEQAPKSPIIRGRSEIQPAEDQD